MESKELVDFYTLLNNKIQQQLLDGAEWHSIKDQLDYLTEVSKEMTRRCINFNSKGSTPADQQLRSETD